MAAFSRVVAAIAVAWLASCSSSDQGDASTGQTTDVSSLDPSIAGSVPLMPASPTLASQCQDAAAELGFAVPCPSNVPTVHGAPVGCDDGCVSLAGGDETLHRLFSMDIADFDGGEELGEVRHARVEARRVTDAPPVACYRGTDMGRIDGLSVAVLDCPERSDESAANTRHGEGAHAGHLLGYWDAEGIRYVVSVHGKSAASRTLLEHLIASIELVVA